MERRFRYLIEALAFSAVGGGWIMFGTDRGEQSGFTPPVSSSEWSWSDLVVRTRPSQDANEIGRLETREAVQVIRRPDGWAAIIDLEAPGLVGFVPSSTLHGERLPTFARAYAQVLLVCDSLRADLAWGTLGPPHRLRHTSNGEFTAVGTFGVGDHEGYRRQYRLMLQYTGAGQWDAVSLSIEYLAS